MLEVDLAAFEALVAEELDRLPEDMLAGLENVAFVVEERAEGDQDLLGLYEGVELTDRGVYGLGELPDRITLFRAAHVAVCSELDELREEIHATLVHEIAHYYGIGEERLHELGWG